MVAASVLALASFVLLAPAARAVQYGDERHNIVPGG